MRILVIEDDRKIASFIAKGLKEEGFAVDVQRDGTEGLYLGLHGVFDGAVVDIMLPGMDGLAIIEQWRRKKVNTPVLILSAKRSVDDRIKGLRAGGDDYLTKPFAFSELLARIQALIRRATRTTEPTSLTVGGLVLNLLTRQATREGKSLDLQARELALLEYFMRNAGRMVSKTSILEHVYEYSFDPQTNVVDVLVHRLRSKVDMGFDHKLIRTVRGLGYIFGQDNFRGA